MYRRNIAEPATNSQVKLKELMYIKWEKPDLNQQVKNDVNLINVLL